VKSPPKGRERDFFFKKIYRNGRFGNRQQENGKRILKKNKNFFKKNIKKKPKMPRYTGGY
jgi:hypothetical protein